MFYDELRIGPVLLPDRKYTDLIYNFRSINGKSRVLVARGRRLLVSVLLVVITTSTLPRSDHATATTRTSMMQRHHWLDNKRPSRNEFFAAPDRNFFSSNQRGSGCHGDRPTDRHAAMGCFLPSSSPASAAKRRSHLETGSKSVLDWIQLTDEVPVRPLSAPTD